MQWHGKTQGILAISVLCLERGLDFAGITNQHAAQILWVLAALLVVWAIYINKEELSKVYIQHPFRLPFFIKKDEAVL